jgi:hypothetical protein
MTSLRQIAANRLNARLSTGPKTDEGKRRSRRNALRHGLTAETVIEIFEDVADDKGFEANIIADYDAHTTVERELVLRLASLLWRLRRATSIETDLLRIQAEILRDRHGATEPVAQSDKAALDHIYRILRPSFALQLHQGSGTVEDDERVISREAEEDREKETSAAPTRAVTHSFLRLINLDNCVFDRLGRYEAALWRQTVHTLLALEPLRRRRYRFG